MKFNSFVGVDVSKNTLDFSLVIKGRPVFHQQTENSLKGIQAVIKELRTRFEFSFAQAIICMEHTGIYNNHLLEYLSKRKANIWLETGLNIKYSGGMQRGKNDKVDSERIALYAYKNRDAAKLWKPARGVIRDINSLTTLRSRIIKALKQLKTPLNEDSQFMNKSLCKQIKNCCSESIKALEKDLKKVNKQIEDIIKSDDELNRLFNLVTSVDGGAVTATEMIITTNEFKDFTEAKKYACYSGVAPFEHSSGTSIRGKNRVSHMANKTMKTLLHMAAISVINMKGELSDYYQRKVDEGKNKMSVINAIRNKLIQRVFVVVRENREYQKNYVFSLVNP